MYRKIFQTLALWWITALAAYSQLQVLTQLNTNRAQIGSQVILTVSILNSPDSLIEGKPTFAVDGLAVSGPQTRTNAFLNIDNVEKRLPPLQYVISPQRTGEFTIPAFTVQIAGQPYQTQPQTLSVVAAQANDYTPVLRIALAKTEFWEGEQVQLIISLLLHQQTQMQEAVPSLERGGFAMKPFMRGPQSMRELNGAIYNEVTYYSSVYAMKSGNLKLGPATMKPEIYIPSGQRNPFGQQGRRAQSFELKSNELDVTIKPLPAEGRPEGFNGAVGNFALSIQAQPNRVTQGDPLTALLIVRGKGNYDTLVPPVMEKQNGWRTYEPKVVQENRTNDVNGAVVYSQIIEPEVVTNAIPSYVLHFFNPDTAKYQTARTESLPITILPSAKSPVGPGTAISGAKDFGTTGLPLPSEQLAGLLGMTANLGKMTDLASHLKTGGFLQSSLPVHLLGVLALGGILYVAGRRFLATKASQKQTNASQVRAADLLQDLRGATAAQPQDFYAKAAQFLDLWEIEKGKPATDANLANRIRLKRDFFCYSSAANALPIAPTEATEILRGLEQL